MGTAVQGIGKASGSKAGVDVFGKSALGGNDLGGGQVSVMNTGDCRGHFVGGSGRIGGLQCPVEQRIKILLQQIVIFLEIGRRIIGGIAGAGQHLAGLGVHHHHRTAFHIGAILAAGTKLGDQLRHGVLCGSLEVQINGNFHIPAGHRLLLLAAGILLVVLLLQGAIFVGHIHTPAVGAMEIFLKGQFETGLTDLGIHGIGLPRKVLVIFPLLLGHCAHVAQNMGGILGGIDPDRGGLGLQTGQIQLQDRRQLLTGSVLQKNEVGQIGDAVPQIQLVAQTDHSSGIAVRPFLGDLIQIPQLFDQQRCGDIRVQTAFVR